MLSHFSEDDRKALKEIFGIDLDDATDSWKIGEKCKPAMERIKEMGSDAIGKEFKATRERIQEIEAKAMEKLRKSRDNPPDDVA